jgi:hypothetical protein
MSCILKVETNSKTLSIYHDDDASFDLDAHFDGVSFISNHKDTDSINTDLLPFDLTLGEIVSGDNKKIKGYETVKVTSYIHGDISLTADPSPSGQFNCRFDSGTFGFLVFKKGELGVDNIGVNGFVKGWENMINGRVYLFIVEDKESGEVVESCGGFIGDCLRDSGIDEGIEDEELCKALLLHPKY